MNFNIGHTKWCILLIGITAVMAFTCGWGVMKTAAYLLQPALKLSTEQLILKNGKPGERVWGSFFIKNAGWKPLAFEILSSCGCAIIEPVKGTVPVDGQQEIRLAIELPEYTDSARTVKVLVKSNDPKRAIAVCQVLAKCPAALTAEPAFVDFGELTTHEVMEASRTVLVREPSDEPIHASGPIQVINRKDSSFAAEINPSNHEFQMVVRIAKSLPPGEYFDFVKLKAQNSDIEFSVPIRAEIVEPVSVAPSTVYFYKNSTSNQYKSVDVIIWSRSERIVLGKLTHFEGPSDVTCKLIDDMSASRKIVRVFYDGVGEVSPVAASLILHFHGLKEPIVCKVAIGTHL